MDEITVLSSLMGGLGKGNENVFFFNLEGSYNAY